jgi:hypothetical protein
MRPKGFHVNLMKMVVDSIVGLTTDRQFEIEEYENIELEPIEFAYM